MTDLAVPVDIVVHEGMDAVHAALDGGLAEIVGPDRSALWRTPRAAYRPQLWLVVSGEVPVAAVLTTGRPATAATTLVEPWWTSDRALGALLDRIVDAARARGDAALKWRTAGEVPAAAIAAGFTTLRAPHGAVGTESTRGAVRWLVDIPHAEPGYYAQTTLFTCGAVAALMAAGLRGADGFAGDPGDRDRELDYWRRASNYPACEPVGLAVTTAQHFGAAGDPPRIEVALDSDGPVLVEDYRGFDLSFRTELQTESRRRAAALGIPITSERVSVTEIARRVAGGELALLLIDEEPMHGEHGPHWVLAHASDGAEVIVIEDPWINRDTGETWVDTHELPVRAADLDRLVRWSAAGYRGVVFLGS